MSWILLRHSETDGVHLAPEGTEVPLLARGWVVEPLPEGLDADDPTAPAALAEVLAINETKRQADARKKPTKAAPAGDKKE